jgi:DNA-binding transcriptional ArsR family regulator
VKPVQSLDRRQLRLLADPLRHEILRLLCTEELSTRELAGRISRAPSNLYYHVDQLRKAGLIRIARRRRVRGAVEKFYRASAESYTVPPALLQTGGGVVDGLVGTVESMVGGVMARFRESATRGLLGSGAGQVVPMVTHLTVRTTPGRIEALRQSLEECIRSFEEEPRLSAEDAVEYTLLDVFFPADARRDQG